MLLMCDITICSEDAIIYDLHYDIGSVPGDGIHSCVQELLGVKRAAYALLTGQTIDAKTALEYGMVNEIHPREKLIECAYKLADHIMTQPRTTRRMTTQIVRRPWRRQITDRLDSGTFSLEGDAIVPLDIGHTDTDHTTCLHVPSFPGQVPDHLVAAEAA
jgi:enoyl-CoA hydratase/carnithine racemase